MTTENSKPLAVVTGATGGIGRATVARLAKDGWRLHLVDLKAEILKALANEIGGGTTWAASDLATQEACSEALPAGDAPIDALVHLAGVFEPDDLDPNKRQTFVDALQHNAVNAYDLSVVSVPRLKDGGRIVLAASLAFNRGVADHLGYAMSKGAIMGLVRSLSRRLGNRGICVNALAPGIIDTVMTNRIVAERGRKNVEDTIPLGRLGRAEDISGVVAFLLSADAAYITGQAINIDGGIING